MTSGRRLILPDPIWSRRTGLRLAVGVAGVAVAINGYAHPHARGHVLVGLRDGPHGRTSAGVTGAVRGRHDRHSVAYVDVGIEAPAEMTTSFHPERFGTSAPHEILREPRSRTETRTRSRSGGRRRWGHGRGGRLPGPRRRDRRGGGGRGRTGTSIRRHGRGGRGRLNRRGGQRVLRGGPPSAVRHREREERRGKCTRESQHMQLPSPALKRGWLGLKTKSWDNPVKCYLLI